MRRTLVGTVLCLSAALFLAGCEPPNHLNVTPDGNTMSFAMDVLPRYTIGQGSQLYAFDIENCRLRTVLDHPGMNTWVSTAGDGSEITYSRCYSQAAFSVFVKRPGSTDEKQLGEVYNAYGASSYVPGDSRNILAYEGRVLQDMRWVLFDASGKEVNLPIDKDLKAVPTDSPALARNRAALPVWGWNKEYPKNTLKPYAIWVNVINLSCAQPVATQTAAFEVYYHEIPMQLLDNPTIDLAFSPDAKKLVMSWYTLLKTTFYEIDATGKEKPKELFSDARAWKADWTSDSAGVVYLRAHPDPVKYGRLQVMLWHAGDKEAKPIVELPGLIRQAGTQFRRLEGGRLRIAHFSNEGIRVVDCLADGTVVSDRTMTSAQLDRQKTLARFEFIFRQNPVVYQWQAPYEVLKNVKVPTPAGMKREDDVAQCLENAFNDAKVWGKTPNAAGTNPNPSSLPPTAPAPTIPSMPSIPVPSVQLPLIPTIPAPTIPTPTIPMPEIPTPTIPVPEIPAPTIPGPTIPAPEVPAAPTPTTPAPDVKPAAPAPAPAPATAPNSTRGRMVTCPHCGQTFFVPDDK